MQGTPLSLCKSGKVDILQNKSALFLKEFRTQLRFGIGKLCNIYRPKPWSTLYVGHC